MIDESEFAKYGIPDDFRISPQERRDFENEYDNVVSTGIGHPIRDGELRRDEFALRVTVEEKLPPSEIEADQLIPDTYAGVPTDVREQEIIEAATWQQRARPTPVHENARIRTVDSGTSVGCSSAGRWIDEDGDTVYLTNRHCVTASFENDNTGGESYYGSSTSDDYLYGTVKAQSEDTGDTVQTDAATVNTDASSVLEDYYPYLEMSNHFLGTDWHMAGTELPQFNQVMIGFSAYHGTRGGYLHGVDETYTIRYDGGDTMRTVEGCISYDVALSGYGSSGSAVGRLNPDTGEFYFWALNFAVGSSYGIGSPLSQVQNDMGNLDPAGLANNHDQQTPDTGNETKHSEVTVLDEQVNDTHVEYTFAVINTGDGSGINDFVLTNEEKTTTISNVTRQLGALDYDIFKVKTYLEPGDYNLFYSSSDHREHKAAYARPSVPDSTFFQVDSIDYVSETTSGSTLDVTANLTNTGNNSGEETVTLYVDGVQEDSTTISMVQDESRSTTLTWNVPDTAGEHAHLLGVYTPDDGQLGSTVVNDGNAQVAVVNGTTIPSEGRVDLAMRLVDNADVGPLDVENVYGYDYTTDRVSEVYAGRWEFDDLPLVTGLEYSPDVVSPLIGKQSASIEQLRLESSYQQSESGYDISGTVFKEGNPVSTATVVLVDVASNNVVDVVETNASGEFSATVDAGVEIHAFAQIDGTHNVTMNKPFLSDS